MKLAPAHGASARHTRFPANLKRQNASISCRVELDLLSSHFILVDDWGNYFFFVVEHFEEFSKPFQISYPMMI
jgi:hypothetical protein